MTEQAKGARSTIVEAFTRLVLARRDSRPPVADVLSEAGVARSTFYEHFDSRDSLLLEAFRTPLGFVADAATREEGDAGAEDGLIDILDHLRDYKRGAVDILTGPLAPRVVRALAELISERLPDCAPKPALHLADIQIGFIRLWLTGETPYAAHDLARLMIRSAAAQRAIMTGNSSF
ncbi:MAG TPA: TetR/AcrR family transcriptional regulator [Parvularculaceae bacterium]|nr:TetR/AcrR family transcriptional regulator [Parvularculaceae bacterium]